MIATKRKKRSGLSGLELDLTVQAIKNLIAKWQVEEADDDEGTEVVQLQSVLDMLKTKLDGPQSYSFSGMTFEHLAKLQISVSGILKLKPGSILRAAETDFVGEDEHWSANGLYRHLCLLECLVPRTNEAATRLWINAFFFRVASMSSRSSKIVLSVEQNVPPIAGNSMSFNCLSGFVDFTAILTTTTRAEILLQNPILTTLLARDHALFVSEAKGPDQRLVNHVPQAICEMYACAKRLGKAIIRGALTNGHEWMFFILKVNEDGNGCNYFQSKDFKLMREGEGEQVSRETSSLIAAIITHWIWHSHEDIGIDDYFTTVLSL